MRFSTYLREQFVRVHRRLDELSRWTIEADRRFEHAYLSNAHLDGADLIAAHLDRADLSAAHLEGADRRGATGVTQGQIDVALGDAATKLPDGLPRPRRWTAEAGEAPPPKSAD